MSLKRDAVYGSRLSDRIWKWDGLHVWTRVPYDIKWHLACGWPQPQMSKRDLEYYVNKGDIYEVNDEI